MTDVLAKDKDIHSFLEYDAGRKKCQNPAGPLANIPCGVKDNIAVEGFHLTCASKILETLFLPTTQQL